MNVSNVRLQLTSASGKLHMNLAVVGSLACFPTVLYEAFKQIEVTLCLLSSYESVDSDNCILTSYVCCRSKAAKGLERAQVVPHNCALHSKIIHNLWSTGNEALMSNNQNPESNTFAASKSLCYRSAIL